MLKLIDLCIADKRGRNGESHEPLTRDFPDVAVFLEKTKEAGVATGGVEPLLKGADVADLVSSGPVMGKLLEKAYEAQIAKGFTDKQLLREYILKMVKTSK